MKFKELLEYFIVFQDGWNFVKDSKGKIKGKRKSRAKAELLLKKESNKGFYK